MDQGFAFFGPYPGHILARARVLDRVFRVSPLFRLRFFVFFARNCASVFLVPVHIGGGVQLPMPPSYKKRQRR